MNVLLVWSKNRSKAVASTLREWLPLVIPGIEPWMSSEDIAKGREWFRDLQEILREMRACIICLTTQNVRSPWIYYEAGAISNSGPEALIAPYLLGMNPSMLADGPLGQRQCTKANREETWQLVKSLNDHVLDSKHEQDALRGVFEERWFDLAERLKIISETEDESDEDFIASEVDQIAGFNISSEARTMIVETSRDKNGLLIYSHTGSGKSFGTNGRNLCPDQAPRTVAKWKSALGELQAYGLLEANTQGDVFSLTKKGFDIADVLLKF